MSYTEIYVISCELFLYNSAKLKSGIYHHAIRYNNFFFNKLPFSDFSSVNMWNSVEEFITAVKFDKWIPIKFLNFFLERPNCNQTRATHD